MPAFAMSRSESFVAGKAAGPPPMPRPTIGTPSSHADRARSAWNWGMIHGSSMNSQVPAVREAGSSKTRPPRLTSSEAPRRASRIWEPPRGSKAS